MDREEFIRHLTDLVNDYINYYIGNDKDPQIRINPLSLNTEFVASRDELLDIAYSNQAVEEAALADDEFTEESTDYQASQDPDYYAVKSLVRTDENGKTVADTKAINAIVDVYFK